MKKRLTSHLGRRNQFPASFIVLYLMFSILSTPGLALADRPDAYEPDNSYDEAQVISDPVIGVSGQPHTFHEFFDEDWFQFNAEQGARYKIDAISPSVNCDPVIEIYWSDGTNLLKKSNYYGAGANEFLVWMCPEDGTYFIRLTNNSAYFGSDIEYRFSMGMMGVGGPTLPGYVQGKVTSGGVGLGGVRFESGDGVGMSQADGSYVLGLWEGTQVVNVRKDGYSPQSFTVNVVEKQTVQHNVVLDKIPTGTPPTISGTPLTSAKVHQLYSFIPNASDPDGDSITFSIRNRPGWAYFNPDNGMFAGIPGAQHIGLHGPIGISVTDSQGMSASLPSFNLEVRMTAMPGIILLLSEGN